MPPPIIVSSGMESVVQDQQSCGGITSVKSKLSQKRESLHGGMLRDLLLPGEGGGTGLFMHEEKLERSDGSAPSQRRKCWRWGTRRQRGLGLPPLTFDLHRSPSPKMNICIIVHLSN